MSQAIIFTKTANIASLYALKPFETQNIIFLMNYVLCEAINSFQKKFMNVKPRKPTSLFC